jgi:hypothetical protein
MTVDVLSALQAEGWPLEEGDLGENVLVSGLPYSFFRLGKQYVVGGATVRQPFICSMIGEIAAPCFDTPFSRTAQQVEITEAIAPCGNLCRLSWLDKSICPKFIKTLTGRWAGVILQGSHFCGIPRR